MQRPEELAISLEVCIEFLGPAQRYIKPNFEKNMTLLLILVCDYERVAARSIN